MKLKQVIHYPETNSVEATWVDSIIIPAVGIEGEEGYVAEQVTEVTVKCHSYDQVQMDMLEADLGADAAEYAELIANVRDNQIPVPPAPVVIPSTVTMRQARLALLQVGLLAQVNTAVAAADEATQISWEFSSEVLRGNPLVTTLATALNLTEAQLDDLFTLAATL